MTLTHVTDCFPRPDHPIPEDALYRGRWVHNWTAAGDRASRHDDYWTPARLLGGRPRIDVAESFRLERDATLGADGEAGEKARLWWGYVKAWEQAKRDLGASILAIEQPMRDERRGYCGRPDRRVTIKARRGTGTIDLKCDASCSGTPTWYVGMQTAAYVGDGKDWRGACVLHPDGSYRWHDDRTSPQLFKPTDWREFLARLYVTQQDISRGLRQAPGPREE